jgi:hypothetical protein
MRWKNKAVAVAGTALLLTVAACGSSDDAAESTGAGAGEATRPAAAERFIPGGRREKP